MRLENLKHCGKNSVQSEMNDKSPHLSKETFNCFSNISNHHIRVNLSWCIYDELMIAGAYVFAGKIMWRNRLDMPMYMVIVPDCFLGTVFLVYFSLTKHDAFFFAFWYLTLLL